VSVRRDQFKLIRGRRPELYDYRNDPKETTNLAERRPDVVASLDQILSRMAAARSKHAMRTIAADPEAERRLQALGYVSGSTWIAAAPSSAPDPRDKTGAYRALMRGRRLLAEGPESEGVLALQTLLAQEPDFAPAHRALREDWLGRRRFAEAERWLRGQIARRSGDPRLLVDLAVIYRAAKQPDRALAVLSKAVERHPDDTEALTLSGEILRDLRRYDAALDRFARADKLVPGDDTTIKMQIATTLLAMGRLADCESTLNEVLAVSPHTAGAHYLMAQIADQRRDTSRAVTEYRREIAQSPWDYRARFNLARLLAQQGGHREALELLEPIPKLAPDFYEVYFYLAKALLDAGDSGRFQDAIAAAQLGLKMAPASSSAPLGHYTLSDIYRLQGRHADSQRELSLGQQLERRLGQPPG
jgi:tetratricopeptide (TPR) repeat protein